jgi:hypothetical protein
VIIFVPIKGIWASHSLCPSIPKSKIEKQKIIIQSLLRSPQWSTGKMDVTCPKEPDICFRFAMKKTPL